MGYNGYPTIIRSNGLLITRTWLNPDKSGRDDECLEVVQIDPNVPEAPKPKKTENSGKERKWYDARELRRAYDECENRHCGMF